MFAPLVRYYLDYFQEHGEPGLITICNCKVPSDVLLSEYKKLEPLEQRPEKERRETWQYIKETFPNKDFEEQKNCMKIVYTIGNLI